jgi:ferritin-like metal-binding protein YciE
MEKEPEKSNGSQKIELGSKKLRTFFINHLDKIYSAKAHLVSHLPQLLEETHFSDLSSAIQDTINDVEKQMARMEVIYELLDAHTSYGNYGGLAGLIDDAFEDIKIQKDEPELRDLSVAFYLQNIEYLEMGSFQILQMAAVKLKNKQIQQLLKENYDETKADRTLLLLIAAKYVSSNQPND